MRPMFSFTALSAIFLLLVIIPVTSVQANPPDRFVFPYDDTHPAPRFTNFCGFPVTIRESGILTDTIFYDHNGNYQFETLTTQQAKVVITNALTGKSLTSPQAGLIKYGLDTASSSGLIAQYQIPGGGLIMLDTGRFLVDLYTGHRIFEAGVHDYIEGDWQALCDALSTP